MSFFNRETAQNVWFWVEKKLWFWPNRHQHTLWPFGYPVFFKRIYLIARSVSYHKIRSLYNTIFLLVAFFTTLFSLKSGEKGSRKKPLVKKLCYMHKIVLLALLKQREPYRLCYRTAIVNARFRFLHWIILNGAVRFYSERYDICCGTVHCA